VLRSACLDCFHMSGLMKHPLCRQSWPTATRSWSAASCARSRWRTRRSTSGTACRAAATAARVPGGAAAWSGAPHLQERVSRNLNAVIRLLCVVRYVQNVKRFEHLQRSTSSKFMLQRYPLWRHAPMPVRWRIARVYAYVHPPPRRGQCAAGGQLGSFWSPTDRWLTLQWPR